MLPILALLLIALGVYIARGHRRALIGAGLGFAASLAVLAIVLAIVRSVYLNSIPDSVLPSDAAAALFDTFVKFIKEALRTLLVVGLVVAARRVPDRAVGHGGRDPEGLRVRVWVDPALRRTLRGDDRAGRRLDVRAPEGAADRRGGARRPDLRVLGRLPPPWSSSSWSSCWWSSA